MGSWGVARAGRIDTHHPQGRVILIRLIRRRLFGRRLFRRGEAGCVKERQLCGHAYRKSDHRRQVCCALR